jgi:pre-mRNA-splicing factor ATP-dependent RNA helicase DHX16
MFQHQPPPKLILWFELVLTSREYARQVMEIKPEWLLEGEPQPLSPPPPQERRMLTSFNLFLVF